ncbi:hypothetical protein INR49_021749, partial [Caranx melampygus]
SAGEDAQRGPKSWDESCLSAPCLPETSRRSTLGDYTLRLAHTFMEIGVLASVFEVSVQGLGLEMDGDLLSPLLPVFHPAQLSLSQPSCPLPSLAVPQHYLLPVQEG